jgi:hypothetical protein
LLQTLDQEPCTLSLFTPSTGGTSPGQYVLGQELRITILTFAVETEGRRDGTDSVMATGAAPPLDMQLSCERWSSPSRSRSTSPKARLAALGTRVELSLNQGRSTRIRPRSKWAAIR